MLQVPPGLAPASLPIIDHIQRRLEDLSSHQIPRLRQCKGPLSVQQEIARELRGDIARLEQRIEVRLFTPLVSKVPKDES